MMRKIWEKCFNYETVSYFICGVLTTLVDFGVYALLREAQIGVEAAQALSWLSAVLFAYVGNKLIVFRNYNIRPSYLTREFGAFFAARAFSGVLTWMMMVGLVRMGGQSGFLYELFCKALVSAVNLVLNYIFSKLWIFKKQAAVQNGGQEEKSSETAAKSSGEEG